MEVRGELELGCLLWRQAVQTQGNIDAITKGHVLSVLVLVLNCALDGAQVRLRNAVQPWI